MTVAIPVKICGMGRVLPKKIVKSDTLDERIGKPPGWIEKMQGVVERRWLSDGETALSLGAEAARQALSASGYDWSQIDCLINASGTQPQAIPDGAALLQRELGLGSSGLATLSVHTTCMSFLTALDVAAAFIMANRYRRLLLVTSDVASVGLNWEHPESSTLFGDLAVAAVVERTPNGEESCFQAVHFETYGDGANHTAIPGGGTLRHPNNPNTKPSDNLFHMNGAAVLQMAFEYLPPFLERVQPGLNKSILDIKWVVPHQASKVAINVFRSFNWPPEQIINILGWSGNCVAASLPGALYQGISDQRIRRGDPVLLLGFGAGLCFGAIKMIF